MKTLIEEQFYEEFEKITSKWCHVYTAYDGKFGNTIKIDDSFTSKELREIANLLDKYKDK